MIIMLKCCLFKRTVVWAITTFSTITPVLLEIWIQDNLILRQRQQVVAFRDILDFQWLRGRRILFHMFHKDMPTHKVEPALPLKNELLPTLISNSCCLAALGSLADQVPAA